MNTIKKIIHQIKNNPETIEFQDIIKVIDNSYKYLPTRFINGPSDDNVINEAGENEGSCKIFSFAKINKLNEEQTLNCFGEYYRSDVLKNPDASDHANIRTFIKYGWKHVNFDKHALTKPPG